MAEAVAERRNPYEYSLNYFSVFRNKTQVNHWYSKLTFFSTDPTLLARNMFCFASFDFPTPLAYLMTDLYVKETCIKFFPATINRLGNLQF